MLVANNQNTRQVRIQDNVMNLKGPGTALGLTGENFLVKGNEVHLELLDGFKPQSAIQVGNVGSFGGMELGTSMNNSVIEGNVFDGSVEDVVISFVEGENASHDNIFRLGESIAAVDAPVTIRVSSGACNNTFEGNTGIVEDASASECTTIGK